MTNKNILIRRGWWIFFAVLIVARLYLTGDRDILALNSPHDEYWYIHSAFNRIWGGPYNEMTLIHLPVYSIWLACLDLFGIPARLAIDVCWLLATSYLAFAVYRLTRVAWIAALLFAFLAFHPYVISIFDRALAETFLTVVSAAVLAAAIELWNSRDNRAAYRSRVALIVYAAGFAIAYHTRKEGIVLAVPLLLLACWSIYDRQHWWRGVNRSTLVVPLLLAPLLATVLLGVFLSAGNYLKWRIWARHELAAPGYERAIAALSSIDAGPTPWQITVTKEMISLAYRESPTFLELKPAMEGNPGQQWVALASPYVAAPGEIGNGWFYWALRGVAAQSGWHANARLAESKYAAAADELEQAFRAGRLKKRRMLSSFVDPDLGKWMPQLPTSIYNVSKVVVRPVAGGLESPTENASPGQLDHYATVTGRRRLSPRVTVNGWIVAPAGSLIGLGAQSVTSSWQRVGQQPRPDVPGAYGFAVSSQDIAPPTELLLQMPGGQGGSVPLSALATGMTATIGASASARFGIDGMESNARPHRADRWLTRLSNAYVWFGYLFCLAALGAVAAALIRRQRSVIVAMLLLMIAAIAARVALFGILDASSWSGTQARYVLPIIPFFACMGALGLALSIGPYGKMEQK